jgi:hypothetical protein
MGTNRFLHLVRLLLVVAAVFWAIDESAAQTKPMQHKNVTVQSQTPQSNAAAQSPQRHGPPIVITDAAGRVHFRSERITYAQRRFAAKRRVQAIREAAARRKLREVQQ